MRLVGRSAAANLALNRWQSANILKMTHDAIPRVSAFAPVTKIFSFRLARRVGNRGTRQALAAGQGLVMAAAILNVARQIVEGVSLRRARARRFRAFVEPP